MKEERREVTVEELKDVLDTLGVRHGTFVDNYYVDTKRLCHAIGLHIDAGYQDINEIVKRLNETE